MITKDSTTSRSRLSQPAPVFHTIANRSMDTLEYCDDAQPRPCAAR